MNSLNIDQKTTRLELARIITKKLNEHKIYAVLVGGAVVSIYTENEYESHDLDFISPHEHKKISLAMSEIGFYAIGKNFHHNQTSLTIEFPSGPLGIGDRVPIKPEGKIKIGDTVISLFSPTQSVMDRLAWFYFNNDRQCLDQAVMIYKHQPVNLSEVKKWSKEEKQLDKFDIFVKKIKEIKK